MPVATHPTVNSNQHSGVHTPSATMSGDLQHQSQWLFTEEELLLAPSIAEGGLSPEKERENRGKGVNFIQQAGIMLKLPQITLVTASVFLHRFYMRHSMVDTSTRGPGYHYYSMAATCLFLATKVEENCRKMKELVVTCVRVAQKDRHKVVDEQDKEYWRWRDNILHSEDILLEALCFDLSLEAPYQTLFDLAQQFHVDDNKRLRKSATAFVNDSCLTVLCLLFPSRIIAASAFYFATKCAGIAFPDDDQGRPWWSSISVDISDIRRACNHMAEMYENVPAMAGREGIHYEKTPDIQDLNDSTRSLRTAGGSGTNYNGYEDQSDQSHSKRGSESGVAGSPTAGNNGIRTSQTVNGSSGESPHKKRKLDDGGGGLVSPQIASAEVSRSTGQVQNTAPDAGDVGMKQTDSDNVSEEGEVES